jgi:putative isomerase
MPRALRFFPVLLLWAFFGPMSGFCQPPDFSGPAGPLDLSKGQVSAHDPVIAREGDTYYVFSTGNGLLLHRSRDLDTWERVGRVLAEIPAWTRAAVPGLKEHLWAPDISFFNGRWHLYYSASTFGKNRSAIGLVTSPTLDANRPDYRWEDQGLIVASQPGDGFNAIDPNIAFDEHGQPWLSFGSFWGGLKLCALNPATGKPVESPPVYIDIASRPVGENERAVEAPFIVRRGEWFYLFASYDFCCKGTASSYHVRLGRARHIAGPYLDRDGRSLNEGGGTTILTGTGERWHGPGHNAVFTEKDRDWLVYHAYDDTDRGRSKLRMSPLRWDEAGWPQVEVEEPVPGLADWAKPLHEEADKLGKPAWRPLLRYAANLHARATHPPAPPFALAWQDTGPGYGYGPAFGHWDIVHEILDILPASPRHARRQLLNNLRLQLPNGFLPGLVLMPGSPGFADRPNSHTDEIEGHPPLWVVAADEFLKLSDEPALRRDFLERAQRQIRWFEAKRRAAPDGFFYNDIATRRWESGIDQGVRFDDAPTGPHACVDATAHVYQLCLYAAAWARKAGQEAAPWQERADRLREFIRTQLWEDSGGFFHDRWAIENPAQRRHSFEGLWPVIVGAASDEQARRVIDEWLLNPRRFFTTHPIATVVADDPKFELRMWRGPAWNSMTYWAAVGCLRYGRPDAARALLERALDDTAAQFERSGTLWEFYHPHGGEPESLARKPQTKRNQPWPDYLGHNPVFAMTRLWQTLQNAP